MSQQIFFSIPFDQLKLEISESVKKEMRDLLTVQLPTQQQTELLTRKQAAQLLSISLPTLNEWTKEGRIKGYRIASRIRYKRCELVTSLQAIKTGRD